MLIPFIGIEIILESLRSHEAVANRANNASFNDFESMTFIIMCWRDRVTSLYT